MYMEPNYPKSMDPVAAEFVRKTISKTAVKRPSASELLCHRWITEYDASGLTATDTAPDPAPAATPVNHQSQKQQQQTSKIEIPTASPTSKSQDERTGNSNALDSHQSMINIHQVSACHTFMFLNCQQASHQAGSKRRYAEVSVCIRLHRSFHRATDRPWRKRGACHRVSPNIISTPTRTAAMQHSMAKPTKARHLHRCGVTRTLTARSGGRQATSLRRILPQRMAAQCTSQGLCNG